jgi:4-hydroxybenzoate polyprenyltransferase
MRPDKLIAFFKLLRWFHELLAILPFLALFLVIRYYADKNGITCNLSAFNFVLVCLCVQLLIATGCVLNDIMDRKIDKINKPHTHIIGNKISLRGAIIIFATMTGLLIILSVYISLYIQSAWAFISPGVYILSILYDVYFKRSPLMGNILMAALTAFIPLCIFTFAGDCIRSIGNERVSILVYLYAFFPFLVIIPRELSLDISDMEGDKADNCRTLPILIGARRSKIFVAALIFLIIVISIPVGFLYTYLRISLLLVDALLFVYLYKLRKTETRIEYIRIGRFLWAIMILGLIGFTISTVFSD